MVMAREAGLFKWAGFGIGGRTLWGIAIVAVIAGAFLTPPAPFSIDEAIYADMANAMAKSGRLDTTPSNLPDGAPTPIKSDGLVKIIDGKSTPQYPALYGVIAAPFMALFGVNGLILLNGLSALICLWLTGRIAAVLVPGADERFFVRASVLLTLGASIFAGYIFAIWPHMLALAFVLGGADAILRAGISTGASRPQDRLTYAFIGGLLIGFGVGVRIDVILAAISGYFWLRIFARPSDRMTAISLIAGLAPGLLTLAFLNASKFGAFNPFSYGNSGGRADASEYLPVLLLVALAAIAALIIDRTWPLIARPAGKLSSRAPALSLGALVIALLALVATMPAIANGLYFLVVDIEAFQGPARPGLERGEYGYWDFWGVPKKSLLQSMPFLPLAILPLIGFVHGKRAPGTSFALFFAVAPVSFYALSGWQGGMAFNMRYFLPATPFLAILCARGLADLVPVFRQYKNLALRAGCAGALLALGAYALSPVYGGPIERPMQLYPQLALALVLAGALVWHGLVAKTRMAATLSASLAAVAITFSGSLSFYDMVGYVATRSERLPYLEAYADHIEDDALVLTSYDELLTAASLKGAAIARADQYSADEKQRFIAAYHRAERCVYAHTLITAQSLGRKSFEPLVWPDEPLEPGMTLFAHKNNPARCAAPSAPSD